MGYSYSPEAFKEPPVLDDYVQSKPVGGGKQVKNFWFDDQTGEFVLSIED